MNPILGIGAELLSPFHLLILGVLGILLFGKRLPEIGRSLGKGIVEFKKGLKGMEDDFESPSGGHGAVDRSAIEPPTPPRPPQRISTSVPKFEDNAGVVRTENPQNPASPPPQA